MSGQSTSVAKGNIKIDLQSGSQRDVFADWSFSYKTSGKERTKSFEYQWSYKTSASSSWFDGGSGSVNWPYHTATYSTPATATKIRFRVKPVSDTYKNDKEDVEYFKGSWSKWEPFTGFIFKATPPSLQVKSGDLKLTIHTNGDETDTRPYAIAEWPIVSTSDLPVSKPTKKVIAAYAPRLAELSRLVYLKNYEYKWEYYNPSTREWEDGGKSGNTPDLTPAQKKAVYDGEIPVMEEKFFLTTGQSGDSTVGLYEKVRFTVTPVATDDGDGAFKAVAQSKSKAIKLPTLEIKNLRIVESKNEKEYMAIWYVENAKIDHLESFEVQWQYDADAKDYFHKISTRPKNEIWLAGGSGTVNKADHLTNLKTGLFSWTFTFSPHYEEITKTDGTTIIKYAPIRLRVKPIGDDTKGFIEEWTPYLTHSFTIPEREVSSLTLSAPDLTAPRQLEASWGIKNTKNVASFSYEWLYTTRKGGPYNTGTTGTVDFGQAQPSDGDSPLWVTTYTAPAEAKLLRFRVKPVPSSDVAFTPTWQVVDHSFTGAPLVEVEGITLRIYDADDREVFVSWDAIDISNFLTEKSFEALGIPGNYSDYTAAQLEEAIRGALISNYEVRWQYYYLDTWFDGSSTSTTTLNATYTVPEEADKISVAVKVNSANEDVMVGVYGEPLVAPMQGKPFTLDIHDVKVAWYEETDDEVVATFSGTSAIPSLEDGSRQADVIFEWSNYRYGRWESVTTETVTPEESVDNLQSKYTVPAGSTQVRVRIMPDVDTLEYIGEYTEGYVYFNTVVPEETVANLSVQIQKGSQRTCVATWSLPESVSEDMVESFTAEWQYLIDNIWYEGSSGEASLAAPNSTYDAPENAEQVRVRVKPNPKYAQYFTGSFGDTWEYFNVPEDVTPEVPDVPTIEVIDGNTFTATVDSYDSKSTAIEFEIVNEVGVWKSETIDISLNRAVFQFDVASGHKYRARARGVNDDNETGEWSNYSSDQESYPPPLPTDPVVIGTSGTSVELTWNAPTTGVVTGYTIEYTKKINYFDAAPEQVQTAERDGPITRAEIIDMDASEWFFRIRTKNSVGNSEWSAIVSVTLGTAPTAPTTWSSRTTVQVGEYVYLYWTHNSADESAETSAILELIVNGVSAEYEIPPQEDGSTNYLLLTEEDLDGEKTIEWRVKTAGVTGEYGPWSTQRIVRVYQKPTLQMVLGEQAMWEWDSFNFNVNNIYDAEGTRVPIINGEVDSFPISVYLDAYPTSQTPTAYILTVTSNNSYEETDNTGMMRRVVVGQEIFKKYYNTSKQSFMTMLLPENINLENGMSYTITATVAMDSGLSASVSQNFSVSWDEVEYNLNAEMALDRDNLTMRIRPYAEAAEDDAADPENVTLSVYRREFDGTFTKIADKLSNVTRPTVVDPHPALDYARYRIVAQSEDTGAVSFNDLPGYPVKESGIVIQWDEQWQSYDTINPDALSERPWSGSMIKLPWNIKVSDSNTLDIEMVEYIGRRHPVSYYGTQVGQKGSWSSDIPKTDVETIYALRRLAVYTGNAYVREPNGSGYWAHVEVSMNIDYDSVIVPVSVSVVRVEGGM